MDITGKEYIYGIAQDKNGSPYLFNVGELVRCKDCEYYDKGDNEVDSWEMCKRNLHSTSQYDFCSWAKMKGGAE